MKRFALIGAAGFVAERHMKAISDSKNELVAAVDKFDSVGIIDRYFPNTVFFTEFERFDRHIDKLRRSGKPIEYVSVCSPNYLHDAHIRFGLRNGANVICEKPIVLNPWNIDSLIEIENETGMKVYNILQLRLHPLIINLKKKIKEGNPSKIYDVELTYITSRGGWYYSSWKGDISKSGGIATNIGVHFFDMLYWIFGDVVNNVVHLHEHDRASGYIEFKQARVKWFLSINYNTLPEGVRNEGKKTYRSLSIENELFDFSEGFTELHTASYEQILAGDGFELKETKPAIEIVHSIRTQNAIGLKGDYHPFAKIKTVKHPFS